MLQTMICMGPHFTLNMATYLSLFLLHDCGIIIFSRLYRQHRYQLSQSNLFTIILLSRRYVYTDFTQCFYIIQDIIYYPYIFR